MESKQLALTLHFYSQPHLISAYVPSWNQQSVKTKEVPVFLLLLLLTIGFFFIIVDLQASLYTSRLISRVLKLTTMKISNDSEVCKTQTGDL
jgi:hypothetical protein